MGLDYESAGFAVMLIALSSIPGSFAGGQIADHIGLDFYLAIIYHLYL